MKRIERLKSAPHHYTAKASQRPNLGRNPLQYATEGSTLLAKKCVSFLSYRHLVVGIHIRYRRLFSSQELIYAKGFLVELTVLYHASGSSTVAIGNREETRNWKSRSSWLQIRSLNGRKPPAASHAERTNAELDIVMLISFKLVKSRASTGSNRRNFGV